jgi:hypothetical protein
MRTRTVPSRCMATAALGLLLAASPASAATPALAPLGAGWGWALLGGVISAADAAARTITLTLGGQGELEILEAGGLWRRAAVGGTQVVHVLPATVISGAAEGPGTLSMMRPGTPATVWAAVHGDGGLLGLKIVVNARAPRAAPASPLAGVVLRRSATMIQILTPQGTPRGIIVTGATAVHDPAGALLPLAALAAYDVLRVEGTVNSDGSVAATRIDLEMQASRTAQVSGTVSRLVPGIEGLVVGGIMVALAPGSYLVKGAGALPFSALAVGERLVVYGTPIMAGSTPLGLRGRVVVGR